MMELPTMTCAPQAVLPFTCGHTRFRSRCGAQRYDDKLMAGTWRTYSCSTALCFDASGLPAAPFDAAFLCISVNSILPFCHRTTLCIEGPGGGTQHAEIDGTGPQRIDIRALLRPPFCGTLRLSIAPASCHSPLVTFEPVSPVPCILIPSPAACCECIRAHEQEFLLDFAQTEATPPIDTALARQSTFFVTNTGEADMEACTEISADALRWVQGARLPLRPDETKAFVAKYHGKYARIRTYAAENGQAEVIFVGQLFG